MGLLGTHPLLPAAAHQFVADALHRRRRRVRSVEDGVAHRLGDGRHRLGGRARASLPFLAGDRRRLWCAPPLGGRSNAAAVASSSSIRLADWRHAWASCACCWRSAGRWPHLAACAYDDCERPAVEE